MPTKVQNHTNEPHPYDKIHDPHLHNKNWVHREALQLALGSILTPKRPHPPSGSRSTSGSLSPAYSTPHTPGTGTPVYPQPFGSEYLHPHHVYLHSHHTPSKLAQSSSSSHEGSPKGSPYPSPTAKSPMMLPALDPHHETVRKGNSDVPPSPGLGPVDDADPRLRPLRPTLTPLQPHTDGVSPKSASLHDGLPTTAHGDQKDATSPASGRGTPKAKFFEALQGKGAWDALIHGSFS